MGVNPPSAERNLIVNSYAERQRSRLTRAEGEYPRAMNDEPAELKYSVRMSGTVRQADRRGIVYGVAGARAEHELRTWTVSHEGTVYRCECGHRATGWDAFLRHLDEFPDKEV